MSTNGLINVHKEAGFTSSDVVAKLRGILGQKKVGHTGTLDPDATGVLVAVCGQATKLSAMLTEHDKEYIAVCRLGITTDTQDISGRVLSEKPVSADRQRLQEVLKRFRGQYEQIPPMYSALKTGGQRLYQLARQGVEVERRPRLVRIDSISLLDDSALMRDHSFTLEVQCSRGTYIRTLCHDIGEALGCGAVMASLVRTRVGDFRLADAHTLEEIRAYREAGRLAEIVQKPESLFRDLDKIRVRKEYVRLLQNGNPLQQDHLLQEEGQDESCPYREGERVRVYGPEGAFFGVFFYDERKERFMPDIFFPEEKE